jgi:hypothetical protein
MAKQVKLTVGKSEEIKTKMQEFRAEAEEGNKHVFIRMTENERFKIGLQWNSDDSTYNEAHGKFSLTVNEVLPIVLDIAGTEQENPLDYKVRNVRGGTQTIAELLSTLTKHTMDTSNGREEASRSFESGVTTARGFLAIDIESHNDPLNGDFFIKELDPFMVLPDPTCKEYDYNQNKGGAKYIIVDEWEDKQKVEERYPGRKKEIKEASFDVFPKGRFGAIISSMFSGLTASMTLKDDYRHHDEHTYAEEMESNVSKHTNNYRISTYWWKEWKKGVYLQRKQDPLNYLAITDPKEIRQAKELAEMIPDDVLVIEKDREGNQVVIPTLNKTVMIGDVLLTHTEDPFDGMTLYPIVRFAPYYDHGYEYPPVQNLIGPQKLLNFTFSSLVNIVKGLANSGWKVNGGSETAKEWLEDHSSEDGIIIDTSKFGNKVDKIEPNPYPAGYDILTQRGKENMREIAQVRVEAPESGKESGKALAIREQQSQKTKGIIFRNWNQTNILLAQVLVELIRNTNVYSDEEIMAIVDEEDLIDQEIMDNAKGIVISQLQEQGMQIPSAPEPPNPIRARTAEPEIQARMLEVFQAEADTYQKFVTQVEEMAKPIAKDIILKLLRSMQQGRYGVKVDTSPMAPTMRFARNLEVLALDRQLLEGGRRGISREMLIDMSDVPNKEEIMNEEPPVQPLQETA